MMLMKKIVFMKIKKSSMHNYFKEVQEISNQLESINFSILHELDVLMILNSLPIHYTSLSKLSPTNCFCPL